MPQTFDDLDDGSAADSLGLGPKDVRLTKPPAMPLPTLDELKRQFRREADANLTYYELLTAHAPQPELDLALVEYAEEKYKRIVMQIARARGRW